MTIDRDDEWYDRQLEEPREAKPTPEPAPKLTAEMGPFQTYDTDPLGEDGWLARGTGEGV